MPRHYILNIFVGLRRFLIFAVKTVVHNTLHSRLRLLLGAFQRGQVGAAVELLQLVAQGLMGLRQIRRDHAVFARQISFDAGATETVMFRDGFLSEAAASNVWVVKDGCVIGTPKDNLVLEGIRYGLMEALCQAQGIPFSLRRIDRAEVFGADEVLLTSATKEVLPVTRLDGQLVGTGRPGPVYQRLYEGYQRAKAAA